ncbi:hypothetical protein [Devosia sp. DBB001]|nr:hypothetical protein [Devosia sp. DBB001]
MVEGADAREGSGDFIFVGHVGSHDLDTAAGSETVLRGEKLVLRAPDYDQFGAAN